MSDVTYDQERAAILATAVGAARLRLLQDDATGALEVLDSAAATTRDLHRRYLLGLGYTSEDVDSFLVAASGPKGEA